MSRFIARFNLGLGALAGAATVLLMLSVVPDLLSRSLFGVAIYGMAEASTMLLVFIVFLALPAAQVRREHFQVTLLDNVLPARGVRALLVARHLASAAVTGLFAWYATTGAWESTLRLEQSYAVVAFPVWPGRIATAAGLVLLTVQFLIDAWHDLRAPAGQA